MRRVMIGTAGHIDHGKTTLTQALTGKDPTRHPEERARGMSIDIGFAPLFVEADLVAGLVDVPGHERFIRNMVAGATGIDLVLFVVAADDAVMPQTREHLQIMQILGIRSGVVALTKADVVEPDALEMAKEDVQSLLKGTFLEKAPICPVAAPSGRGIAELKAALHEAALKAIPKSAKGIFRLPIQRVFVRKGFGTIVTGIPFSGRIKVGEAVEVVPPGKKGRVRGIQAYGQEAPEAQAGHSVSLNLTEISHEEIERGDVVAAPGALHAVAQIEARFQLLPGSVKVLRDLSPIRLLVGTAEVCGRLVLVGKESLAPGQEAYVQLRLDQPVVVVPGDRYILRLESPLVTLGGGTVIGVSDRRLRRSRADTEKNLAKAEAALADPRRRVQALLEGMPGPVESGELARQAMMDPAAVSGSLAGLEKQGAVRAVGKKWVSALLWEAAAERLEARLADFHKKNPAQVGFERAALREQMRLDPDFFNALALEAVSCGRAREAEGGRLALRAHTARLSEGASSKSGALEEKFRAGFFSPPSPEEAVAAAGMTPKDGREAVGLLLQKGILVRVADGVFFHRENVERARELLIAAAEAEGKVESGKFRDQLKTTRKYVIPLLEYFDAQGLTKRVGSERFLRKFSK